MKTQRLVARDAFELVAPMVRDSGVCETTPEGQVEILKYINRACFNLHKRIDSEGTLFEWYVSVDNCCFAMPQDCREIRQIAINGLPMRQRSEFYIGKVATGRAFEGCCGPYECRDLGDFYIPHYLPKVRGIRIALVALDGADAGREVTVEVTNEHGIPCRQTLTLLEKQQATIMDEVAYDVTFFKKPKTFGPVSLQLHYDDGSRFFFCQYLPQTEEGLFRRKQMPQRFLGCNIACILGKTRHTTIDSPDDIIPFNDLQALRFAIMAESALQRRDHQEYAALMLLALGELKAQMQDADSAGVVKQVNVRTNFANPSLAGNFKRWV